MRTCRGTPSHRSKNGKGPDYRAAEPQASPEFACLETPKKTTKESASLGDHAERIEANRLARRVGTGDRSSYWSPLRKRRASCQVSSARKTARQRSGWRAAYRRAKTPLCGSVLDSPPAPLRLPSPKRSSGFAQAGAGTPNVFFRGSSHERAERTLASVNKPTRMVARQSHDLEDVIRSVQRGI